MAAVALAAACLSTAGHAGFLYVPQDGTAPVGAEGGGTVSQRTSGSAAGDDAGFSATGPAAAEPGHGRWRVRPGETLREVLDRWGGRAGIQVMFLTDRRYRLHEGRAFSGSFLEATGALFSALSHLPHPPAGEAGPGGGILAVLHRPRSAGDGR